MNINEILKNDLYNLVVDIACGGMVIQDYTVEGAWENDKLLTLDDLLLILNSNNTKRFLNIVMRYEEGFVTIKSLLRHYCVGRGLKFENSMSMRMFKVVKEIANEMIILSDKNEEDLQKIEKEHGIKCTDVMQYALFVERSLIDYFEE